MNITKDVINDLLPLYFSEECSPDTKALIDEYLRLNPAFAKEVKPLSQHPLPTSIPYPLAKSDEMSALRRTRRLIKRRTYLIAFAIFFSLAPFSFLYTNGKLYWLFSESPKSAIAYLIIGAVLWMAYFVPKWRARDL